MIHICTTRLPLGSTIKRVEHCIKQWNTNIAITDVLIISLSCLNLSKSIGKAPLYDRIPIASRESHERILPCYDAQHTNLVCFSVMEKSPISLIVMSNAFWTTVSVVLLKCLKCQASTWLSVRFTMSLYFLSMFRPIKGLLQDDCVWSTTLKHARSWRRPLEGQIIVKSVFCPYECILRSIKKIWCWQHLAGTEVVWSTSNSWPNSP